MSVSASNPKASASQPPSNKATLTLAQRFANLSEPNGAHDLEEVRAMTVQHLGSFMIDFGRAMKGRSFQDVVENEASWTKWICERMINSEKKCHQIFLIYVEKYTAEAEALERKLLGEEPSGGTRAIASRDPGPVEAPWDMVTSSSAEPALQEQVNDLSGRLGQMEGLMQQVLAALHQMNPEQ